ncbi:helix-turn-helix domain-containing protein [Streptomyces sp. RKAG290]|uniref:helix-turn-helix domain-containing protein n=1 Tax=Streptomyces sp. RKAG290 TaxID=2888348 RepID=UPI002033E28A|nr:helix-turn-helix domain-containing protein [Streptomyces sp. RKAG290]MCM2412310.1 helix-turn-helix domain-containing protein [Streptomyces sp. RKAG290]
MGTQKIIAPSRAPSGGVVHANARHTSHFTVVGNHLAQHRELSLVAIGLATHIQSLPAGARIGIKCMVERFPESEARIAGALRELEAHGYLKRTRERLPNGRVVTHTTSYNQPCATRAARPTPTPAPAKAPAPAAIPAAAPAPPPALASAPASAAKPPSPPSPPAPPAPPLPRPRTPDPELHRAATALLLGLRREAAELVLSEGDVRMLTPAVATWLERGAAPGAVSRALTADLPVPLKYPGKLLAHRLTVLLPAAVPVHRAVPMQNCDDCDRAFRAPEPGRCGECRAEAPETRTLAVMAR